MSHISIMSIVSLHAHAPHTDACGPSSQRAQALDHLRAERRLSIAQYTPPTSVHSTLWGSRMMLASAQPASSPPHVRCASVLGDATRLCMQQSGTAADVCACNRAAPQLTHASPALSVTSCHCQLHLLHCQCSGHHLKQMARSYLPDQPVAPALSVLWAPPEADGSLLPAGPAGSPRLAAATAGGSGGRGASGDGGSGKSRWSAANGPPFTARR